MYCLRSENLTGLGAPMGRERTWDNWVKYFNKLANAKAYAEADYDRGEKLKWFGKSKNYIHTRDLGFVMYHIEKMKVEDE